MKKSIIGKRVKVVDNAMDIAVGHIGTITCTDNHRYPVRVELDGDDYEMGGIKGCLFLLSEVRYLNNKPVLVE